MHNNTTMNQLWISLFEAQCYELEPKRKEKLLEADIDVCIGKLKELEEWFKGESIIKWN